MLFTRFYLCQKKQKPGLYLQQAGNKLLNMFFHKCSYKISCFSELPQKHWHHSHNNINWLKQSQSHFH